MDFKIVCFISTAVFANQIFSPLRSFHSSRGSTSHAIRIKYSAAWEIGIMVNLFPCSAFVFGKAIRNRSITRMDGMGLAIQINLIINQENHRHACKYSRLKSLLALVVVPTLVRAPHPVSVALCLLSPNRSGGWDIAKGG